MDYSLTEIAEAQGALDNDDRASDLFVLPDMILAGTPSDPSLRSTSSSYQWNLVGTWGIRADEAWLDYTGAGVRVAVLDDGFEYTNSELSANYNRSIDFDTTGSNDSDAYAASYDDHGTAVAGVIAADDNGIGLVGVAHDAELMGIRLDFYGGIQAIREGFQHAWKNGADVLNNSWGYPATFVDNPYIPYSDGNFGQVQSDLIDAVSRGRDGLGMSVVFAAGNHRSADQDVNNHMLQSSPYTIAVAGTDKNGNLADFSTPGAALLTAAPAEGIYTVDKEGSAGYVSGDIVGISGTSFSAPTISGVIALMYEANPDLGYRDVQDILALASRKANQTAWQTNGATNWNGGGMHFSHDYGFGLIDSYAAVRLAESWTEQKTYANMETVQYHIAPNATLAAVSTNDFTFTVTENIVVEHALVNLILPHDKAGDLVITLISPEGTESVLVDRLDNGTYVTDAVGYYQGIRAQMDSTANWGELSAGTWTIRIEDRIAGNDGVLQGAYLTILGSQVSSDTMHYFTDEFRGATLSDTDGGVDTLNLAAVRGNAIVDLSGAVSTRFSGQTLGLTNPSVFENIIAGDGNDRLTGNAADNVILAGRGDDMLIGSAGDDTLDGQQGFDSVSFAANLGNFLVEILDDVTARLSDMITAFGTNIIKNVENFLFSDHSYSWSQLVDHAGGIPVTENILYEIKAGSSWNRFTSDERGGLELTASDVRYRGSTQYVQVERDAEAITLTRNTAVSNPVSAVKFDLNHAFDITAIDFPYAYITLGGTEASTLNFTNLFTGRLYTGAGHDVIDLNFNYSTSRTGTLRVYTGEGDDTITGLGGAGVITNYIYGEAGNDVIHATGGKSYLYGGEGDDTLTLDGGYGRLYGGEGNDSGQINGGRGTFYGGAGDDNFLGGVLADSLKGEDGEDVLRGNDGNDKIYGNGGNDVLYGDDGDDYVDGGAGDDTLYGGIGKDKIYAHIGNDQVYGGSGNDNLYGNEGDDLIFGEEDNDYLNGGFGADMLDGGQGNDKILGYNGDDVIFGGEGNDTLLGQYDNDFLFGGDGDDHLDGGYGNDFLDGGNGNDKILGYNGDDTIFGGAGNDALYGQNDNDTIFGGEGDDYINAGYGNDHLYGGEGTDILFGDRGADTFHFDLTSVDTVRGFSTREGDVLDISDLLSGYTEGVSDINDFVIINVLSTSKAELLVNSDGAGADFQAVGLILSDFSRTSVDQLHDSGALVAG